MAIAIRGYQTKSGSKCRSCRKSSLSHTGYLQKLECPWRLRKSSGCLIFWSSNLRPVNRTVPSNTERIFSKKTLLNGAGSLWLTR